MQTGAEPDLAEESLGTQHHGQVGMEDLQGYGAIVLDVVGQKDPGHATTSQLPLDPVAVGQGRQGIQHAGQPDSGARFSPQVEAAPARRVGAKRPTEISDRHALVGFQYSRGKVRSIHRGIPRCGEPRRPAQGSN